MCASPQLSSLSLAPIHSRPCARQGRRPLRSSWSSSDQTPAAAAAAVAASGAEAAVVTAAAAAVTVAAAATHGARQVVALTAATARATCLTTKAQGRCACSQAGGGQGGGGWYGSLSRQQGRGWVEKGPRSCPSSVKVKAYLSVEIQPCLLHSQSNGCCDCFDAQLWQVLVGCAMRLARWAHSHLAACLPHAPPPPALLHIQGPLGPGGRRCPAP